MDEKVHVMSIDEYNRFMEREWLKRSIPLIIFLVGLVGFGMYMAAELTVITISSEDNSITDIRNGGLLVQAARGMPFPDKYDMLDAEVERFVHHTLRNSTATLHTIIMQVRVGDESGHVGIALFSGALRESECVDTGRGAPWPCGGPPLAYHHDVLAYYHDAPVVDCGGTGDVEVAPGDTITVSGCFALPAHMDADVVALVGNEAAWGSFGNYTYAPHRVMLVDLVAGSPVPHLSCERTGDSVVCE